MVRCQMNFKRLSLTDIKIDIKRIPKKATLIKALDEAGNEPFIQPYPPKSRHPVSGHCYNESYLFADVKNKWENSSWGKKLIVQKRRASLNDFDRFKVMLAKIKVRFSDIYS